MMTQGPALPASATSDRLMLLTSAAPGTHAPTAHEGRHMLPERAFACAWCRQHGAIPGGLPYYAYRQTADGRRVVAADPAAYSGSDGICPAHVAAVRAEWRREAPAA
jgi:hypothetical protein